MTKDIVLIELFSGIGGFAKGLSDAGFNITHHYFSEIDKHAIANYKYNFPNAEYIGSVVDVSGEPIRAKHPHEHIIVTFGFPCQDISIAGKRKGLIEGTRSSLLFEAGRIIIECSAQTFIAENVKGLSSVNEGRSIYEALRFLTFFNTDSAQYTVELQLLNTSWLLPQNRERYYFVGHIGTRGCKRIFPITENDRLFNDSEKSNKRYAQAKHSATCFQASGTMKADDTFIEVQNGCVNNPGKLIYKETANNIDANYHKGADIHAQRTIVQVKQINDSKESNGQQPYMQNRVYNEDGLSPALSQLSDRINIKVKSATKEGYEIATEGDSINFSVPNSATRRGRVGKLQSQTLDTQSNQAVLLQECNIRRLTEIECERLQGFPDNWTKYGNYDGVVKEISKTQRYKMLGNAVTVDVVKIIGKKLLAL